MRLAACGACSLTWVAYYCLSAGTCRHLIYGIVWVFLLCLWYGWDFAWVCWGPGTVQAMARDTHAAMRTELGRRVFCCVRVWCVLLCQVVVQRFVALRKAAESSSTAKLSQRTF